MSDLRHFTVFNLIMSRITYSRHGSIHSQGCAVCSKYPTEAGNTVIEIQRARSGQAKLPAGTFHYRHWVTVSAVVISKLAACGPLLVVNTRCARRLQYKICISDKLIQQPHARKFYASFTMVWILPLERCVIQFRNRSDTLLAKLVKLTTAQLELSAWIQSRDCLTDWLI